MDKKYYPLQAWAITVFTSPLVIYLFFLLKDLPQINLRLAGVSFMVIVFVLGGIFMLPTFLIYSFVFDYASKKNFSTFLQKIIPLIGAGISIFATYYLVVSKIFGILFDYQEIIFPLTYALALAFTSLMYRMETGIKFSGKKTIE